jgi:hypothetical protein
MRSLHPDMRACALRCLPLIAAIITSNCTQSPKPAASAAPELTVATAYEALEGALDDCEKAKRECSEASSCEASELQACEATFKDCREAARPAEEAMREAERACHEAQRACNEAATTEADREACREEHDVCHPHAPKPPCHAALDACLDAAREADRAARGDAGEPPPAPPPPAHEGPGREPPPIEGDRRLPECDAPPAPRPHHHSDAEEACHEQAHECMIAEMEANPPAAHPKCPPRPHAPPSPVGSGADSVTLHRQPASPCFKRSAAGAPAP